MEQFCLLVMLLGAAFAQQIPHFLYINSPILELDRPLKGLLDQNDGQNFKDGSRTEVVLAYFEEGQVVEIHLKADFDGFLSLYSPQKALIALNDDGLDTSESRILLQIPQTGRYSIIVSGFSQEDIGSYTLRASRLEVVDDAEITLGASLNAFLSEGDDVDAEGRVVDKFVLELAEATDIDIQMVSSFIDSYLLMFDAQGNLIAENDDRVLEDEAQTSQIGESDLTSLDAQLRLYLEAGIYEIWATTVSAETYGFYQISARKP